MEIVREDIIIHLILHFDVNVITTITFRQDYQLCQQSTLLIIIIVPAHYLLHHEYIKLDMI